MTRALLATVAILLALVVAQSWRLHREQLAHSHTITIHAAEQLSRIELAREAYILASRATTGVDHAHQAQLEQIRRTAVSDRAFADGVRGDAEAIARAAGGSGATCGPDDLRALAALGGLVAEVSGLVAEGKERAAEVGAQASGLQAYARAVCMSRTPVLVDRGPDNIAPSAPVRPAR